jgi:hypothetical protein
MKQLLSLALLCTAGTLVHASDKSAYEGMITLGNFVAKKYALDTNITHWKSAISDSFLIGARDKSKKNEMLVFDRKDAYKCKTTLPGHFDFSYSFYPKVSIIQDEYLIATHRHGDGLWVDKIDTFISSKNVKLQDLKYKSTRDIDDLHAVPTQPNVVSFVCEDAAFFDIVTGQVISTFPCPKNQSILIAVPNSFGTGILYRTGGTRENPGSIGHYDMRSQDNLVLAKDLPFDSGTPLCTNEDDSQCMVQSTKKLTIYDVKTCKREVIIPVLDDKTKIEAALFATHDTIVFATEDAKKDLALHAITLSSGDTKTTQLEKRIYGVSHHHNSPVFYGTDLWGKITTIYEFDFKQ